MKKLVLLVSLLGLMILAGCDKFPRFVNHSLPDFTASGPALELSESIAATFNCTQMNKLPEVYNGLDPNYPILQCYLLAIPSSGTDYDEFPAVYTQGCLVHEFYNYVIEEDGQLILLDSQEKLQKTYAPIDSMEEALSYAVAASGYDAYFGQTLDKNLRYLVDEFEDTRVEETSSGYTVYLFYYRLCGCGPHSTYSVPVLVNRDGVISLGVAVPLFEDPKMDNMCVD